MPRRLNRGLFPATLAGICPSGAQGRTTSIGRGLLMAQYTINSKYRSIFGMDVHARSITIKGFDCATGRTKTVKLGNCPVPAEVASWMSANFEGPIYAAYESGCTGFHLCRELRALGVNCDVIAVSSIPRSVDDKLHKNDKRDAARLLGELLNPVSEVSVVWCPDAECEAARNLTRVRFSAAREAKAAKQRVSALLLTHGYVWNERTPAGNLKATWTREHKAWISKISLGEPAADEALAFLLERIEEAEARVALISKRTLALAQAPRWKPFVDALCVMKGIDVQTALLLSAAYGDFERFNGGGAVVKCMGLSPSESSSDESTSRGRIDKAGDAYARYALIEAVQTLSRQTDAPKALRQDQQIDPSVLKETRAASRRVLSRYLHLIELGKGSNKAKVAAAAELARQVWAVGRAVQRAQTAQG